MSAEYLSCSSLTTIQEQLDTAVYRWEMPISISCELDTLWLLTPEWRSGCSTAHPPTHYQKGRHKEVETSQGEGEGGGAKRTWEGRTSVGTVERRVTQGDSQSRPNRSDLQRLWMEGGRRDTVAHAPISAIRRTRDSADSKTGKICRVLNFGNHFSRIEGTPSGTIIAAIDSEGRPDNTPNVWILSELIQFGVFIASSGRTSEGSDLLLRPFKIHDFFQTAGILLNFALPRQ